MNLASWEDRRVWHLLDITSANANWQPSNSCLSSLRVCVICAQRPLLTFALGTTKRTHLSIISYGRCSLNIRRKLKYLQTDEITLLLNPIWSDMFHKQRSSSLLKKDPMASDSSFDVPKENQYKYYPKKTCPLNCPYFMLKPKISGSSRSLAKPW